MKLLIAGKHGSKIKELYASSWESIAEKIFKNTDFEDDVFIVLDEDLNILYRAEYDSWKEEQFLNFNGVRIEI